MFTPKTMARQMTLVRQERENRPVQVQTRLAFTSETGKPAHVRVQERREYDYSNCADLAKYGEHVLDYVEADLPGDRSVGYCSCGKYIDTGTFDERN